MPEVSYYVLANQVNLAACVNIMQVSKYCIRDIDAQVKISQVSIQAGQGLADWSAWLNKSSFS